MGAGRIRAAVALPVAALVLTACSDGGDAARPAPNGWTELPAAPLSPRLDPVTAWTGSEVLVLGGGAADGAALDPASRTWRMVADAPHPIPGGTPHTASDERVHLVLGDRLLTYDADEDAWSVSPPVPGGARYDDVAALDDGTVVVADDDRRADDLPDQLYDLASRTWSDLPDDPLATGAHRDVTAVPGGVVLTDADPAGTGTRVRAALLDTATGTWHRLRGRTTQAAVGRWTWTGARLVDPFATGGALDPYARVWGGLPDRPPTGPGSWPVDAPGGPVSAVGGWVYDDRDGSWAALPRPDGAPEQPGAAVWAGDELVVVGGSDGEQPTTRAWMWRSGVDSSG
jgi:hypothetical protein